MNVLVIEDEKPAARRLSRMLEALALNVLAQLNSVEEAIDWFKNHEHPDLIFLDLNMPEVNGWQFLEVLTEKQNQTQVVIVTSSTSIHDKEKAQKYAQVIDFLEKPLTKNTILSLKSKLDLAG